MRAMNWVKRGLAWLLTAAVAAPFLPLAGVYADQGETEGIKDTDYVIMYARDGQNTEAVNASWDRNIPFPGRDLSKTNEAVNTNVLNDGSAEHPAEAYRELNEIKGGLVTLDFDFTMNLFMEASFRLLDDKTALFGIVTKDNGIYLEQPEGETLYLGPCTGSYITGEFTYVVKAVIDFDAQRIVSVQINGKTVAQDKPYANPVVKANGFDIKTGEEAVGVLINRRLFITGGYHVYECFWNHQGTLPDDWSVATQGGEASLAASTAIYPDKHSLRLDTQNGSAGISKQIDPMTGNVIFEVNTLQSRKRDGFYLSLTHGQDTAFTVTSDGTSFGYLDAAGGFVPFYPYMDNVWYHLKLDLDLENGVCDIYLNNKRRAEKVPVKAGTDAVDGISIRAEQNPETLTVDDILLYYKRVYDKYVEPPVVPAKKDPNLLLSMQMCPLWTEGTHYGWDAIKTGSSDREPLLGFYDESNPEVYDWFNKWMIEHGVDFQFQCVYPTSKISYSIVGNEPIKDDMVREHNGLSGYMESRYSDMMKFAIILECSTFLHGYQNNDEFFNYYLPFYIEHYIRDDRYMTINGRPIIGVYSLSRFLAIFDDGSGDESIRRGIQKMRKLFIDSGVGDPYILAKEGFASNQIKMAADAGLDGVSAYGMGGTAPFSVQKTTMQAAVKDCNAAGIDCWPIAIPARDDLAWRRFTGYSHTGPEFSQYLEWLKSEILPQVRAVDGKKLVSLTTWDEYGEGHIIAPTVGRQFAYLDAIRSSFVAGDENHTDPVPIQEEKDRMDRLYVQDRKTVYTQTFGDSNPNPDLRIVQGQREYDTPETIPETVKFGYYFDKPEDAAKWTAYYGVSEVSQSGGKLIVQPNSLSPQITLSQPMDMDAYDVTYIKLTMKKNPTASGGWLSWTSDQLPTYDQQQRIFFNTGTDNGSSVQEYYIPIGKSVFWKGKINGLRLQLGALTDPAAPFEIQSIEFLRDPAITAADKLVIDGWVQKAEPSVQVQNGAVMVPLRQTLFSAGVTYIKEFASTDTYSVIYNDVYSEIRAGDSWAYSGEKRIALPAAAYENSEIMNDEVFVPLEFIAAVLSDKTAEWDAEKRELVIESLNREDGGGDASAPRKLIDSFEFDSADEYSSPSGFSSYGVVDGQFTATTNSGDPHINLDAELNAAEVKVVEIRITTSGSQTLNFFFITDQDSEWNESKRSPGYTTSPGENIIRFDTVKGVSNWKDTIKGLRLDPAEQTGQTFSVDYIRFYGDVLEASGPQTDMSSCVSRTETEYAWTFAKNTDLDGWQGNKALGDLQAREGLLETVIVGENPLLLNRMPIDLGCAKIGTIVLKLRNGTLADSMRLYFLTDQDRNLDAAHSFAVKVKPMDTGVTEYRIDTASNPQWQGQLRNLALAPGQKVTGSISIDEIKLEYK